MTPIDEKDVPNLRNARQEERDEWNTYALETVLKESDGEYTHIGALKPSRIEGMEGMYLVTTKQLNYKPVDVTTRRANNERIIPVYTWVDGDGDVRHVLTDADGEAMREGYVCPNCLEWQAVPNAPRCNWLHSEGPVQGGCGHEDNEVMNHLVPTA